MSANIPGGWVKGYTAKDTGMVSPHWFYVDANFQGVIIGFPVVCRGSLKTTPDDPGQRITSTDAEARAFFPGLDGLTLAEIQTYKTSGSCGGCPGRGNQTGTGCN